MKKQTNLILAVGLLLAAILCLSGCSGNWAPPYASLDQTGYNVSVRFDAGDGVFAGTKDVYIVDAFSFDNAITAEDGSMGFYLLSPDDPLREEGAFTVSRNGYFLAGWYTERSPRINDQGEPLDDYGVPTSESGRPQGYTYSGKWDFASDLLTVDPNGSYSSDTPVCTLYAAWIPYFNYMFYAVDSESGDVELLETSQSIDLELPEWSMKTGKLDLKKFPESDNKTFDAAYLSSDLSVPMTEKICGADQYVDYETGTTSTESISIYTTWLEGSWFKVYTAEQLFNNSYLDGNYMICADLDFSEEVWAPTLTKGKFVGTIIGNGHTISNVSVIQSDNAQMFGGLFGALDSGALIQDLNFENISYTISAGSRMQGAAFGLLAGSVATDAVLDHVSISGTLSISESCYPSSSYLIGLLCGSGEVTNVDLGSISCKVAEEESTKLTVTCEETGEVTLTFHE